MTQGRKACTKSTPEKDVKANAQRLFVEQLVKGQTITAASETAGICRRTAYNWRESDKEFAEAWDDAIETGTEKLETEATRRALEGSDTLLIFLLKARRPKIYRERITAELTGKDGKDLIGHTGVLVVPATMSIEDWEKAALTHNNEGKR